ncbi:ATP-dependent zinc protease family protein [Rickettsiella endosymbiont of Dermanyssus gallinae]|uniref:ATP-dependent zinc protease family protein n=1 Tax=Rickettsiella endosymbiont of Dermanyssus gallinae TaxID=2856608 RepID=UPI001C52C654|nr:RimK/LysX family protein [Rickettsiella endosymbiont of Dermanyssus gallinae]
MAAPTPIGWREWVSLPELGIRHLKAKVDTGARTSALHASSVKILEGTSKKKKVCFIMRPHSRHSPKKTIKCVAELIDIRQITDSGGHKEQRCVIRTPIVIGKHSWSIEITLTSRDSMRFKMLLGRTALKGFIVDPCRSYLIV